MFADFDGSSTDCHHSCVWTGTTVSHGINRSVLVLSDACDGGVRNSGGSRKIEPAEAETARRPSRSVEPVFCYQKVPVSGGLLFYEDFAGVLENKDEDEISTKHCLRQGSPWRVCESAMNLGYCLLRTPRQAKTHQSFMWSE